MLLNNEETFAMMVQEGLINLYAFIGGYILEAYTLGEVIVKYVEIFPCSWELCNSTSSESFSSKELREPLLLLQQDSFVLTTKHSTIGSVYILRS